jgi:hypothetical protein
VSVRAKRGGVLLGASATDQVPKPMIVSYLPVPPIRASVPLSGPQHCHCSDD